MIVAISVLGLSMSWLASIGMYHVSLLLVYFLLLPAGVDKGGGEASSPSPFPAL